MKSIAISVATILVLTVLNIGTEYAHAYFGIEKTYFFLMCVTAAIIYRDLEKFYDEKIHRS